VTRNLLYVFLLSLVAAGALADPPTPTPFEDSGRLRTPRYAETVAWCADLAGASPLLHLTDFGTSPSGRALPLVIADLDGRFTPDLRDDRTVVLVQACIHAGESCGKDAGMMMLRDLAADPAQAAELLDGVTLLFIPIFNVDGHERFSPFGRINQNGPEEMGWRVTAGNLNLNRDYLKADAPEMRAWLGLFNTWLPDFFIDVHSTDGADYQYALTYAVETHGNLDPELTAWVRRYETAMHGRMADDGFPMFPYVAFRNWHDPRSGLRTWVAGPRFSQGYTALQNRPGLLIETHMLKDYATRGAAADALVRGTLAWVSDEAVALRKLTAAADARTAGAAFRAEPFPLRFAARENPRMVDFEGVEYEMLTSEVTGGEYVRFSDTPATFTVESWDDMAPTVTARLPEAYLVPPAWGEVIARLDRHGVTYRRLAAPAELEVRTWRFSEAEWQQQPYEGRHPVTFTAEPLTETRVFPAGTVVVDMNQRTARVAAHLLEPEGPDALVQWGFFDPVFARVEYVESYVIEAMIPQLLADNPGWVAELEERKAADPEFAADPWAIRYWFYERTPWYDQRVGIYPVGLLDDRAVVDALR
jgi:hypothetical protein